MARKRFLGSGLIGLLLAMLLAGLLEPPTRVSAGPDTIVTTELQPGLNLAGWTQHEARVDRIFREIPRLEMVYAWDPKEQWFRWATFVRTRESGLVPGIYGDLELLTPGMGLWLELGGTESFSWTRPALADAALIEIDERWNLVAWGGGDGLPITNALGGDESSEFSAVVGWDARAGEFREYGEGPQGPVGRGGAVWVRSPQEQRWLQPGAPVPEVVFAGEVADADRTWVLTELPRVQEFFAGRFGAIASDFAIHAYEDYATFTDMVPERTRPSMVFCGWSELPNRIHVILGWCELPIAHEYFHVLQHRLSRGIAFRRTSEDYAEDSPRWMSEGSAVYADTIYEESSGRSRLADYQQAALVQWSALARPLEDRRGGLEREADYFMLYSVGFLAVDWLISQSGEAALGEYYRLLPYSIGGWTEAFENAFGLSVDDFRASLEEYRLEAAPPFEWQVAGRVVGPNGEPVADPRVDLYVWNDGSPAWAARGESGSDGGFSFLGPGAGYTLGFSLVCPGGDRRFGPAVFVGEWGEEGLISYEDGQLGWGEQVATPFTGEKEHHATLVIALPETPEALVGRYCAR